MPFRPLRSPPVDGGPSSFAPYHQHPLVLVCSEAPLAVPARALNAQSRAMSLILEHHSGENRDSFLAQRSTCSLLASVAGRGWQLGEAPHSQSSPACPGESISRSSDPGHVPVHPDHLCDSPGRLARCRAHFRAGSYCGPVYLDRYGSRVREHFSRRRSFESRWSCDSEPIAHERLSRGSFVISRNAEHPVTEGSVRVLLYDIRPLSPQSGIFVWNYVEETYIIIEGHRKLPLLTIHTSGRGQGICRVCSGYARHSKGVEGKSAGEK